MRREPKCNKPEISAEGADLSARHVDLRVRRRSGRVRQAGPAARAASNRGLHRHDRATSRGARSHDFYPTFCLPAPGWPRFEAPGGRIRARISQTSRAFASMHSLDVDDTSPPPPLAEPRVPKAPLGQRDAAGDVRRHAGLSSAGRLPARPRHVLRHQVRARLDEQDPNAGQGGDVHARRAAAAVVLAERGVHALERDELQL